MTTQHDKDLLTKQNEALMDLANQRTGYQRGLYMALTLLGFDQVEANELSALARNRQIDEFEIRLARGPRLL